MTPESEIARLFAADFAAALQRIPRPAVPGYRPLQRRETNHEYERQEMLDGRDNDPREGFALKYGSE